MSELKKRVPAVEGWFTMDEERPRLLGSRCKSCGTYFFPKESFFCRNPNCDGAEFEEVPLSPMGKLWSFTNNCYAALAPASQQTGLLIVHGEPTLYSGNPLLQLAH